METVFVQYDINGQKLSQTSLPMRCQDDEGNILNGNPFPILTERTYEEFIESSGDYIGFPKELILPLSFEVTVESISQLLPDGSKLIYQIEKLANWNYLQTAIDSKCEEVNAKREQRYSQGFLHTVNGQEYRFDGDQKAIVFITGIVAALSAGFSLPNNFQFTTFDNLQIAMSAEDLIALAQTAFTFVPTVHGVAMFHKNNIKALTTAEEVEVYDITQGWN